MKRPALVFFLILSTTAADIELVFLISGSDEFGGNVRRVFHQKIMQTVDFVLDQFKDEPVEYAAVWTFPGEEESKRFEYIVERGENAETFRVELGTFMQASPSAQLSTAAGLAGSLKFIEKTVLSSDPDTSKLVITLTHWEMLGSEVVAFLEEKCSQITTYVLVFPWIKEDCKSRKIKRLLNWFKGHLQINRMFTEERAICIKDTVSMARFKENIQNTLPVHQRYFQFCQRQRITSATTPEGQTTPCPTFNNLEVECITPEPEPCHEFSCRTWLHVLLVFLGIGVIGLIPPLGKSIYDQYQRKKAAPKWTLRDALQQHQRNMMTTNAHFYAHMTQGSKKRRSLAHSLNLRRQSFVNSQRVENGLPPLAGHRDSVGSGSDSSSSHHRGRMKTMNGSADHQPQMSSKAMRLLGAELPPPQPPMSSKARKMLGVSDSDPLPVTMSMAPFMTGKAAKMLGADQPSGAINGKARKILGDMDDVFVKKKVPKSKSAGAISRKSPAHRLSTEKQYRPKKSNVSMPPSKKSTVL